MSGAGRPVTDQRAVLARGVDGANQAGEVDDSAPATSFNVMLARLVARHADSTALVFDGQRLSFAEFDALVGRCAAWLAAQGVVAGDVVALWLVNRPDWLVLHAALARLGAAALAVNTRYRGAEVAYLLERAAPKLLVLQLGFQRIDFAALLAEVPVAAAASLRAVVLVQDGPPSLAAAGATARPPERLLARPVVAFSLAGLAGINAADAPPPVDLPEAPSILFTTSGTTSGPKLVVHTQRSLALHLQQVPVAMQMHAPGVLLVAALPLAGTFGFVSAWAALAAGRPVVLLPTFDAAESALAIRQHQATHFYGSDEMFEALLAQVPLASACAVPDQPFPSLRLCGFAAFRAGAHAVARAAVARGLPMAGLYGSSEVHALFAIQRLDRPLDERLEGGGHLSNPAAEVRVRDADSGALLPAGEVGLLEFRSPSNFIGYLNHPQATAQAIDGLGWFASGDIGLVRPDGSFVYQTRAGDAIRLGGYLVAPAEIEELLKAQPGIAAAQVVAVDLAGKTRAVGFVIAEPGAVVDETAAIAQAARQLAAFKVPARVWVVDHFPVVNSANGTKIQRNRLREMAQQRLAQEADPQPPDASHRR